MQPESSRPCSHKPSTGPYSKPDKSIPHQFILLLQDELQCYLTTYECALLVVSYLLAFPPKSYIHSFPIPSVTHVLPISPHQLYHSNYICRRRKVMKHLVLQLPQFPTVPSHSDQCFVGILRGGRFNVSKLKFPTVT
jgi:hypothetical protein